MSDAIHDQAHAPAVAVSPCWSTIGVQGDGSCPELDTFAHCRNCQVYSRAAVALLDRPLPPGHTNRWTEHFAAPRVDEGASTRSCVICDVGGELFALSTDLLEEATELRTIHSLPHRSGALLGVVNVRGAVTICVSLARLLGLNETAPVHSASGKIGRRRLLVLRHASGRIAMPVEEVLGTHRFRPGEIGPLPATLAQTSNRFTSGLLRWKDRLAGYLDVDRIVEAVRRTAS